MECSDPRLSVARGEHRLARVVQSNRPTVAPTAKNVNPASVRNVTRLPLKVPTKGILVSELNHGTMEQSESRFLLHHMGMSCLPGEHIAPGCIKGRRQAR